MLLFPPSAINIHMLFAIRHRQMPIIAIQTIASCPPYTAHARLPVPPSGYATLPPQRCHRCSRLPLFASAASR